MAGRNPPSTSSRGVPLEQNRGQVRSGPTAVRQTCNYPDPVKRPGNRTKGEVVKLLVNWYKLQYDGLKGKKIYIYRVSMTEEPIPPPGRRRGPTKAPIEIKLRETKSMLFWYAVHRYPRSFPNRHVIVFDDVQYAFIPEAHTKLLNQGKDLHFVHPENEKKEVKLKWEYLEKFIFDLSANANKDVEVHWPPIYMKNVTSQNARYRPADNATDQEKAMAKRFTHIDGAMFYVPTTPRAVAAFRIDVQPGVQAWLGLYASIRRMEDFSPVIHFGLMNKLFVEMNLNLINFYRLIEGESPSQIRNMAFDSTRVAMSREQAFNFDRKLSDIKLKCLLAPIHDKDGMVTVPRERHYKFVQLQKDTSADRCFLKVFVKEGQPYQGRDGRMRKGRPITRQVRMDEWYAAAGYQIRFPKLPLCIVKSGANEDLVPMELLTTHDTPQKYIKMMSFYARLNITKNLVKSPVDHHKHTNNLVQSVLDVEHDPFLNALEIGINPTMIECEGRIAEPCAVLGKDREGQKVEQLMPNKETGSFTVSRAMETPNKKIRFVLCKLTNAVKDSCVSEFYHELKRRCVNRGFSISSLCEQLEIKSIEKQNTRQISKMIEEARDKFAKECNPDKEMLVFLFVTRVLDDFYGQIKYLCDVMYGEVSQVVDAGTITKAVTKEKGEIPTDYKSVYHHICLKLNAKMGGVNQILAAPDEPDDEPEYGRMPSHEKTMFIGIDVIHPSPNSPIRDCSIAAIVASMDKNAALYSARIKVNTRCNESVQHFDEHFAALLAKYMKESVKYDKAGKTGYLPERIVILRDGVSDSEMIKAASEEINSIKHAWNKSANGAKMPPITYVVVQKNHKTRFYKRPSEDDGKVSNPPMGTVVDKMVVTPHMFDFYMVSHYTQLGTTRPIHYTVVYDDCKSKADDIQEMIFRMCFLYARCSKPVSLPSPVYYAHLACERAAFHHEYALKINEIREIVDKREGEDDGAYATRVGDEVMRVERKLQVSEKHPGMYFI